MSENADSHPYNPDQLDHFNYVPKTQKTDVSTWKMNPMGFRPLNGDLNISQVHHKILTERGPKDWSDYLIDTGLEWVEPVSTKSGCQYKGQVKDGYAHGVGIYIADDGSRFEGKFDDGDFNDLTGRWMDKEGNFYQGGFKNARFHGTGTLKMSNGKIISGEWINNTPQGYGSIHVMTRSNHIGRR